MNELLDRLKESSIDFSRPDLCSDIWDKEGDFYRIKPDIEKTIYDALKLYDKFSLTDTVKEVHLLGSLGTNQYSEDTDLDIHLIFDEEKLKEEIKKFDSKGYYADEDWKEQIQKDIKKFYEDKHPVNIMGHPLEVFYQLTPSTEYMADAFYNLTTHQWIKGPLLVDLDFDPYSQYKEIVNKLPEFLESTDLLFAELRRDVIDYGVIKNSILNIPQESQDKLKDILKDKLVQIENDIVKLYSTKKEWVAMRRDSSKPTTLDQAVDDLELVKRWKDTNALFKFLQRYQYIVLIKDLEDSIEGGLTDDGVDKVRNILGIR